MTRGTRLLFAALITHALACLLLVAAAPPTTAEEAGAPAARQATSLPGGGRTVFGIKLATYDNVAKPLKFTMGFKVFYDEDVPRMQPREVRRIPAVRFVSFQ